MQFMHNWKKQAQSHLNPDLLVCMRPQIIYFWFYTLNYKNKCVLNLGYFVSA